MTMSILGASAVKRLPAAIRSMPEKARLAFVFLRMRKDSAFIARELKITHSEAESLVKQVQEALIKSGAVDLIRDPVFFPIDQPVDGSGRAALEIGKKEMDMPEQVELGRFYDALRKAIENAPKDERRLLSLWFNKEMRAKDILNFYKNLGIPLTPGKPIGETEAQDVFYAIEKSVRNLLKSVRSNIKGSGMEITTSSLKAILDETGV